MKNLIAKQVIIIICADKFLYSFFSNVFDLLNIKDEENENNLECAIEIFDIIGKEIEEKMRKNTYYYIESN